MSTAFARAAIFRSAHKHARRMLTWSGFKGTYRQAFAIALRECWYAEKFCAEEAADLATLPPVPTDIVDRARQLRAQAWGCRITSAGNLEYDLLHAQARDLVDTARGLV